MVGWMIKLVMMKNAPCEIGELGMVQNEELLVDASKKDAKLPSAQVGGRVASQEEMMEPLELQIHDRSNNKERSAILLEKSSMFFQVCVS